MGKSPSWTDNRFSVGQEIPSILWNLKIYFHIHKSPLPIPILSQFNPVYAPSHYFKFHCSIILQSTLSSSKWSPLLISLHESTMSLFCLQYVPHVSPILFFWNVLPENLAKSVCHKVPNYVVFSSPFLLRSSYPKISSAASFPQKLSPYVPPSICATNPRTHTKQQLKCNK
jgi:hypothetical protein